jgi:energy-coupling factor transporter transmembrane protein EcfT
MDQALAYSMIAGLALVLLFFLVRSAFRWIVRLAIIGLILLIALGGTAWWWFNKASSRQPETNVRSTPTRRASSDRR